MKQVGVILKVKNKVAIIMTEECEVISIKKQPGMYEGLEIRFDSIEVINKKKKFIQFSSAIGSVAATFIFVYMYLYSSYWSVYAYVDVDMNSSFGFGVNRQNKVIYIEPLNDSGKDLLEKVNLKDKPLETAIAEIVNKSDEYGLIGNEKAVLISAFVKDESQKSVGQDYYRLLMSCKEVSSRFENKNVEPYIIEVKPNERLAAIKNNMSMGRYFLYKTANDQGKNIDINHIKTAKVDELLDSIENKDIINSAKIDNHVIEESPKPLGNGHDIANTDSVNTSDNIGKVNTSEHIGQQEEPSDITSDPSPTSSLPGSPINDTQQSGDYDTSFLDDYDVSVVNEIESENRKAANKIDEIRLETNENIASEEKNAWSKILEIDKELNMSIKNKYEEKQKIYTNLERKKTELKELEMEQIRDVLARLKERTNQLISDAIQQN